MGKYDAVLPDLPKLPPEDASYQAKIDQAKQLIAYRQDAVALADAYVKLRDKKNEVARILAGIDLDIKAHEQLLAESQESKAHGWGLFGMKANALRLASGETIRIQPEPQGKVIDKEAFRQWCIANGYERQLQLWPSTTNALIKERLLQGEPEPDGTEAYSYTKVVLVKGGTE